MSLRLFNSEVLNVNISAVVCKDNVVYFKAKDIAKALGYKDSDDSIRKHVWEENKFEWCVIRYDPGETPGLDSIHPHTKFYK